MSLRSFVLLAVTAALVLTGCGSTADKNDYVKSVNEATVALTKALGSVGNVGSGEPAAVAATLTDGGKAIDKAAKDFEAITPPDNAKHAHTQMVAGLQVAGQHLQPGGRRGEGQGHPEDGRDPRLDPDQRGRQADPGRADGAPEERIQVRVVVGLSAPWGSRRATPRTHGSSRERGGWHRDHRSMSIRPLLLTVCVSLIFTAQAGAVVGGEKIAVQDVPWFAMVGSCGGTLVAPDRVLTAAHCMTGQTAAQLGSASVNGQSRTVTNVAMHPNWRQRNGENYVDDVALVQLASPILGVPPVTLGGADPGVATIVGTGRVYAPGTGHGEAETIKAGGLNQAALRTMTDRECAKAFGDYRPSSGERFDAKRMRCSIDPDGKQPLSSGCFGDSGGPLVTGLASAPVLLGVVSWGSDRCGADHTPSVFADVSLYRAFITDPSPTWMPARHLTAKVRGKAKLTCDVSGTREAGTSLSYVWKRLPRWGRPVEVGTGRTYTRKDRSKVACFVYSANDGGQILAGVKQA